MSAPRIGQCPPASGADDASRTYPVQAIKVDMTCSTPLRRQADALGRVPRSRAGTLQRTAPSTVAVVTPAHVHTAKRIRHAVEEKFVGAEQASGMGVGGCSTASLGAQGTRTYRDHEKKPLLGRRRPLRPTRPASWPERYGTLPWCSPLWMGRYPLQCLRYLRSALYAMEGLPLHLVLCCYNNLTMPSSVTARSLSPSLDPA